LKFRLITIPVNVLTRRFPQEKALKIQYNLLTLADCCYNSRLSTCNIYSPTVQVFKVDGGASEKNGEQADVTIISFKSTYSMPLSLKMLSLSML
jgi:hypothetical protein